MPPKPVNLSRRAYSEFRSRLSALRELQAVSRSETAKDVQKEIDSIEAAIKDINVRRANLEKQYGRLGLSMTEADAVAQIAAEWGKLSRGERKSLSSLVGLKAHDPVELAKTLMDKSGQLKGWFENAPRLKQFTGRLVAIAVPYRIEMRNGGDVTLHEGMLAAGFKSIRIEESPQEAAKLKTVETAR